MRTARTFIASWIALAIAFTATPSHAAPGGKPRVYTNESYIEDITRPATLPLADPKAMLAFILESIPDRVKVYPTENYYYFYFYDGGTRYAGNIRLDAKDRDDGQLHFAYFPELTEWRKDDSLTYRRFGAADGIEIKREQPLVYRVTLGERSVVFELNDLAAVVPPSKTLAPDERFIGPMFDESGIRLFLIFNETLKLFHYVLDETAPVPDELFPSRYTNRILIGRRTGFAFYNEHRYARKILIGVFEANGSVNNYFDGPFDQLPDNFLKGDELRDAILAVDPSLAGTIDRHGGSGDGASRYMISPYIYYRDESELLPFHECATSREIPRDVYSACFVVRDDAQSGGTAPDAPEAADETEGKPRANEPQGGPK